MAGEIPNRFLLWGTSALPWRLRIAPCIEYRNGFSYEPTNSLQDYVSFTSLMQPRFPRYFSADARLSKDFNVGPKDAVRISLTVLNLANHDHPLQVHNNTADPQFGSFFGNY